MPHRNTVVTAGRLVLAVLVLALGGCGGSSDPGADETATTAEPTAEADLVSEYLDALNAGDIGTALSFRCAEAQMEDEVAGDRFADQAGRLVDVDGPITLERVEPTPGSGLEPIGEGDDPRTVLVELSADGVAGSEPLEVVVLEQAGELRLCGVATASAGRLHVDKPPVPDLGSTAQMPQQLMPDGPGEGDFEQVFDGPPLDPEVGALSSWSRAWQPDRFGGVAVAANKFASREEAEAFAARERDELLSDTADVFEAGGGLGLRYLGYAWLWAQPPGVGEHVDKVILLFEDTVVTVGVTLNGADDHKRVQDIADAVVTLAA